MVRLHHLTFYRLPHAPLQHPACCAHCLPHTPLPGLQLPTLRCLHRYCHYHAQHRVLFPFTHYPYDEHTLALACLAAYALPPHLIARTVGLTPHRTRFAYVKTPAPQDVPTFTAPLLPACPLCRAHGYRTPLPCRHCRTPTTPHVRPTHHLPTCVGACLYSNLLPLPDVPPLTDFYKRHTTHWCHTCILRSTTFPTTFWVLYVLPTHYPCLARYLPAFRFPMTPPRLIPPSIYCGSDSVYACLLPYAHLVTFQNDRLPTPLQQHQDRYRHLPDARRSGLRNALSPALTPRAIPHCGAARLYTSNVGPAVLG